MRRVGDRAVLSRAKPANLWRLARSLGLKWEECHCAACIHHLIEWLARKLEAH